MTHPDTPEIPRRPTSSPRRPAPRDDLPQATSSLVPISSIGTRSPEPSTPPTTDPNHVVPGTTSGTTSFITSKTLSFWQHTRDLLVDHDWHPRSEIITIGHHHGLAERTILNLLPRAAARRWIRRSKGHVQLRDRTSLEAALAAADTHVDRNVDDRNGAGR